MCTEKIFSLEGFLKFAASKVRMFPFIFIKSRLKIECFSMWIKNMFFLFKGILLPCFLCRLILFWCLIAVEHLRDMKWSPCFTIDSTGHNPLHFFESKWYFPCMFVCSHCWSKETPSLELKNIFLIFHLFWLLLVGCSQLPHNKQCDINCDGLNENVNESRWALFVYGFPTN